MHAYGTRFIFLCRFDRYLSVLLSNMKRQVLNLAGIGGITDEGMVVLLPRSGPTLEDLTLDGATSLGK